MPKLQRNETDCPATTDYHPVGKLQPFLGILCGCSTLQELRNFGPDRHEYGGFHPDFELFRISSKIEWAEASRRGTCSNHLSSKSVR